MKTDGKDMNRKNEERAVEGLTKKLGCEKETAKLVFERMRARPLVKILTATRVKHDLTQREVAARMGCSESKVCRMESAIDADLSFGDILAYAKAVDLNLSLFFDDSTLPNATRIKHCVSEIASMLKHLTELAREDDEDDTMRNAINRFQVEVLMNFLIKYKESGAAIPTFTPAETASFDGVRIRPYERGARSAVEV